MDTIAFATITLSAVGGTFVGLALSQRSIRRYYITSGIAIILLSMLIYSLLARGPSVLHVKPESKPKPISAPAATYNVAAAFYMAVL